MLIAGLVFGVAVLAIVFAMGGAARAAGERVERDVETAVPGVGRTGRPPDRPAPAIEAAAFLELDERFDDVVGHWNEAQDARVAGRTADYSQALSAAWDALEGIYARIAAQTEWLEEADLEGWAMPPEYLALQKRLDRWDPLRSRVRKFKPMRQTR